MSVTIFAVLWPQQGWAVFAVLAAVPPVIALVRREVSGFAASLLISALAVLLARYAHLVPIAIPVLIFAYWVACRRIGSVHERRPFGWYVRRGAVILSTLLVLAVAGYVLRLSLIYNWSPPPILEEALASPLTDRDDAVKEALMRRFPIGSAEVDLVSALSKQGFVNVDRPHPQCRQPAPEPGTSLTYYAPCPTGSKQMDYEYETLHLFCGSDHISVNWSADPNGKITRLAASRRLNCF